MKIKRNNKGEKSTIALTRRQILKAGLIGAGATLFWHGDSLFGVFGGKRVALAQIPGGTLAPLSVPKYQTPMLIPPVMPKACTIVQRGGKHVDYYEISMKQITQQILPAGLPPTTVWGYGAVAAQNKRGLLLHNAPSLTIEADWNRPVRVKWINDLKDARGGYLPHLLPVDPTLHWANPPGGASGRDMRPAFTETPGPYTGPVPIVTHVHGAVGVGDESDGYAEAWYLPAANNIPIAELDTILEDHKTYKMERAEVSKAKEVRLAAKAADKAKAKEDAWEAGRAARFTAKWKANVPNISPPTEAEFIAMSGKTYKEFLKE